MNNRKPRLQDKVAIVTGAGARGDVMGNGKAVSILFAREGAKVLLVDNVEERAAKTLEAIQKEGGQASVFVADVTKEEQCRAMVQAALDRYGSPPRPPQQRGHQRAGAGHGGQPGRMG